MALHTLSQIWQEVKNIVGSVIGFVYPVRAESTESDRTANCALFPSLANKG